MKNAYRTYSSSERENRMKYVHKMKKLFSWLSIRDVFLILFGIVQALCIKVFHILPRPLKVILIGYLAIQYIDLLLFTNAIVSVIILFTTLFITRNIKSWNVELLIMKTL